MKNWIDLTSIEQLQTIKELSQNKPQVILKHSTRCEISVMVYNRLKKGLQQDNYDLYYLDLLNHRNISNEIASLFDVYHESPQVLVITKGEAEYVETHHAIMADDVEDFINTVKA
jgi:bacillithiol system protein YtxJ